MTKEREANAVASICFFVGVWAATIMNNTFGVNCLNVLWWAALAMMLVCVALDFAEGE